MFNHLLQLNVDKGDKKIYFDFAVYELDALLKFNTDINCICDCYFCWYNSYVTTVKLTSKEVLLHVFQYCHTVVRWWHSLKLCTS